MSVASVPELLRRGALAPAQVSAVDAVMGEDWAPPRARPRRPCGLRRTRAGGRRRAAIGGVLSPNPQALVKLISSGGTATRRGLKAQMDYLSRQGNVPLVSSESTFDTELGVGDAAQIAAAWGLPDTDRGGADRTSHFVVSFPQGTDPDAAERAGRAWAAALFDSGACGERWGYYTAFHTDTAWHVSRDLTVPANITLVVLPPYSPEPQPGGARLALPARALPLAPPLRHHRRHHRCLLRRLGPPRRCNPAQAMAVTLLKPALSYPSVVQCVHRPPTATTAASRSAVPSSAGQTLRGIDTGPTPPP